MLTKICEKYLGCDHKPAFDEINADELSSQLIEDILFGGNFGRKVSSRELEWHMISTGGRTSKKRRNKFSRLITSMNTSVRRNWPVTAKAPLLLPAGWVYFGIKKIRHSAGRSHGKKAVGVGTMFRQIESRQALYDKLELFSVNNK